MSLPMGFNNLRRYQIRIDLAMNSSEYVFRLKKGDLELEVRSNDSAFMEAQMESWREVLVAQQAATSAATTAAGLN